MSTKMASSGDEQALPGPQGSTMSTEQSHTVAGALHTSSKTPPMTKSSLRLPSFEALGIANPRPYSPQTAESATRCACTAVAKSDETMLPFHNRLVGSPANINHNHTLLPLAAHVVATLTPPTESSDILWSPSHSASQNAAVLPATGSMAGREQPIPRTDSFVTPHHTPHTTLDQSTTAAGAAVWLENALRFMFPSSTSTSRHSIMRVLSHALPCPSTEGHVFTRVMTALYEHGSSRATTWISVFHALPGRFNLTDLPRSPPTTPGQPFQGEDYFTQKVFDSAVAIADYQTDLSILPRSPRPAVPPGSVDLAVVERYIPPTSTMEFSSMFDLHAPSILIDRLVELSPETGSLLFIYPTKTGAQTFMQHYLSPVLDPLLRSLAVMYGLPMAFCGAIGKQTAVQHMLEHEDMRTKVLQVCEQLSRPSRFLSTLEAPCYEMSYASTASVSPPRRVWSEEWWTKQEKDRLRTEAVKWTQEAQSHRKSDAHGIERSIASAELLRQLMDGVAKRPYPAGKEPAVGIEINVFVVRRTR